MQASITIHHSHTHREQFGVQYLAQGERPLCLLGRGRLILYILTENVLEEQHRPDGFREVRRRSGAHSCFVSLFG